MRNVTQDTFALMTFRHIESLVYRFFRNKRNRVKKIKMRESERTTRITKVKKRFTFIVVKHKIKTAVKSYWPLTIRWHAFHIFQCDKIFLFHFVNDPIEIKLIDFSICFSSFVFFETRQVFNSVMVAIRLNILRLSAFNLCRKFILSMRDEMP